MGFKVEFHVSVRGDIKISGSVFGWKNKNGKNQWRCSRLWSMCLEVWVFIEYRKNEMKLSCGNMAAMREFV